MNSFTFSTGNVCSHFFGDIKGPNGKVFHLNGESLRQEGEKIWINGVLQKDTTKEEEEAKTKGLKIVYRDIVFEINGNVGEIQMENGTVNVNGDILRDVSMGSGTINTNNIRGERHIGKRPAFKPLAIFSAPSSVAASSSSSSSSNSSSSKSSSTKSSEKKDNSSEKSNEKKSTSRIKSVKRLRQSESLH